MRDLKELSISIKSAKAILDDMIVKAKEQGAKNFDTLFTVKTDYVNYLNYWKVKRVLTIVLWRNGMLLWAGLLEFLKTILY